MPFKERIMIQLRHCKSAMAFLVSFASTFACVAAFAQDAPLPVRHHAIHLTSQKINLPFGNKTFAGTDEDAKIANEHCLLCHSKGMIDTQPPLTIETWKKEVNKMRTAFGCPLRADESDRVAEFISHAADTSSNGYP
jgi:hypothetical protein